MATGALRRLDRAALSLPRLLPLQFGERRSLSIEVWVAGSRQYRAVEDQLIAKPLFAAMKEAGPLPVSAPIDCAIHLQQRQALLNERLRLVADKAARDQLVDVRLSGSSLKITPLQAGRRGWFQWS